MKTISLFALAAMMGLAGCFSLSRQEPLQQHYVLGNGLQDQTETLFHDPDGITIGLRRLQLADYLQTPFVVVRRGPHRITFSEFHRWAEPLGGGINRAVAANLVTHSSVKSVNVAPWPAGEKFDYLIQLTVLHFEGISSTESTEMDGEIHLLAVWEIIRHQDGSVVERGTTSYRRQDWTPGDYAGLVSSLNAALNTLSDDVVAGLEHLVSQRPAPLTTK